MLEHFFPPSLIRIVFTVFVRLFFCPCFPCVQVISRLQLVLHDPGFGLYSNSDRSDPESRVLRRTIAKLVGAGHFYGENNGIRLEKGCQTVPKRRQNLARLS